ncbi:MAG: hypothetical protein IPJ30_11300 [Acidobacteria bacterium]|nr:hypothetical protein [Acidobacteriota bacterium]
MKRFIGSVLFATLLFIGVGGLIEQAGAKFKSDERALALLQKARQAIGGESEISRVKSMTIVGKTTKTFEAEGFSRTEGGDVEINFELPNRMSKMLKFGAGEGGDAMVEKKVDVIVLKKGEGDNVQWRTQSNEDVKTDGVKRVVVKKKDGTEEVVTEDIKPIIIRKVDGNGGAVTTDDNKTIVIRKGDGGPEAGGHHDTELFRTTLSLLLSAPEGLDVSYTYAGEGNVDGAAVEIVDATIGQSGVKLYLDKSTSLPRMISFRNHKPMIIFMARTKDPNADPAKEIKVFERRLEEPQMAEFQVKYSDFRSVGGRLLPFKWTQTVDGKTDETTDIVSYEVNPSNIADKFKEAPTKVIVKVNKDK